MFATLIEIQIQLIVRCIIYDLRFTIYDLRFTPDSYQDYFCPVLPFYIFKLQVSFHIIRLLMTFDQFD